MYKGILDTSLILRFLTGDSTEKKEKFKKLIKDTTSGKGTLLVPLIVIIEMVYVLEKIYGIKKEEVRVKVESLLSLPSVEIESENVVLESLRIYAEENLKFGDAMVLAKSTTSGIKPVYTFDKKDFKKFTDVIIL
ncbi:MAG: PIN domain-containing protein [Nitrospirota bacterium]|nr:PIN domain-containing protein [Nitrospirota bacterium]